MKKNDFTVSRRETLKVATGFVMLGAGLSVELAATPATAAAPKTYMLRFVKMAGNAREALDSIPLPASLTAEIDAGDLEQLDFVWHVKKASGQSKVAQHPAPGREAVAARKKQKAAPKP